MSNKKNVTKAIALSVAAVSSVAVVSYANNVKNDDLKKQDTNNEDKIKLDLEKIDSETVRVSIDNIKDSIKSLQLSINIEGDAKFSNEINWLIKNETSQSDASNINKNVKFNNDNNQLEMFIVSNKSLQKDGNKINICEIKLNKKQGREIPNYKITPNSYKYIVDQTNKQVEGEDIVNANSESLTMNMAPTIKLKNEGSIDILELETLNFNNIISEKILAEDKDNDNLKFEVRNITGINPDKEDTQPVITEFEATSPGTYIFKVTALDKYNEKASVNLYVNVAEVTNGPAPTITGVKENIQIQSGDMFDIMGGISAKDFKGNDIKVDVKGDFDLDPFDDSTYILTYSATDKYGKITTAQTNLTVIANKAPIITGVYDDIISVGSSFDKLEGVEVIDDKDKISKEDITVTGVVNTSKPGEYKLSYSVKDSGNKEGKAQRTITVKQASSNAVTGITIENSTNTIKLNETKKLNATVSPENAEQSVKWVSTNSRVVSVDENGNIKGINYGEATIKAIATDGSKVENSVNINVGGMPSGITPGDGNGTISTPSKFKVSDDSALQNFINLINTEYNISVIDRKTEGSSSIKYKLKLSSNQNSKKVLRNIVGKSNNPYIELTMNNDDSLKSIMNSLAKEDTKAPVLNYDGNKVITMENGENFILPDVKATDNLDDNITISKTIKNSKNEIIDNIDTTKSGTYTIVYSASDSSNNKSQDLIIEVVVKRKGITSIKIDNKFESLFKGRKNTLTAKINEDAEDKSITWASSDENIMKIKGSGENIEVEAINEGTVTVSATYANNSKITDSVEIIVKPQVIIPNDIPDNIAAEIINADVIDSNVDGNATDSNPLKLTLKEGLGLDKLDNYLNNIEKLNPKVKKAVVDGEYTIYKIKISNKINWIQKIFGRSSETYIELKVKSTDTNAINKLDKFQKNNSDDNIEIPPTGGGSTGGGGGTITPTKPETTVTKLIGEDRYETATKISKEGWSKADTVIIVNGNDKHLVDGLTATPLASAKNAPILLSNNKELPKQTIDEIKRLNPSNVIVIGGETSMPSSIINEVKKIKSSINVQRIGGQTRYETSLNIAKELDKTNNITKIYVGAGYGEADSLSISSVAGRDKAPIILTEKDGLDKNTYEYIKSQNVVDGYVIGGDAKISDKALKQIDEVVSKDISGNRISGAERQDTNAKVIEKFYSDTQLDGVVVAKDYDLVDALAVGPLAAKKNMPVLLATKDLSKSQENILTKKKSAKIYETGGGIKSSVVEKLKDLVNNRK